MIQTRQKNHYLFGEGFVWPQHWVRLGILIQHLSVGPVVLNLKMDSNIEMIITTTSFKNTNGHFHIWFFTFLVTDLLEGPFVMSVLCILVDEGIQPLWDYSAKNKLYSYLVSWSWISSTIHETATCQSYFCTVVFLCSLGCLHWFGVKVAFSIHRGLLLHVRGVCGVHVVRRDGSSYSTEAGHGDLEELCVVFLKVGGGGGVKL